MVKQCLHWKKVKCKSVAGEPVWIELPKIIAGESRGTLLSQILAMPKKSPLSFAEAINLVAEKQKEAFLAGRGGRGPGQYSWYYGSFVEWITSLGFHIELTGDEFEAYATTSVLT